MTRAHRLRPLLDHGFPWLTIQVGLELTRAHLALGEAAAARTVLTETERVLERRPDVGSLTEEVRATCLTFVEIGQRLFLSRHTIKTEATSIYRKLNASSRSKAIKRAIEIGLLESTIYPPGQIVS